MLLMMWKIAHVWWNVSAAPEYVIKAQILAGGRGKGRFQNDQQLGGVKFTSDPDEVGPEYVINGK